MSLTLLEALAGGAVVGAGLLLLMASLLGWSTGPDPTKPGRKGLSLSAISRRAAYAAAAALIVMLMTRWLVAAAGAAVLAFFAPALFGGAGAARGDMARLQALASWTESLRDTIAGAVGLEQAIPASLAGAGAALRRPVGLLVDRLRTREPLAEALMKFADDLADPSADLIIAALVLNSRLRWPGLRDVLTSLAQSAREELDVRGRIEASRKSTRRSVQIIILLTVAVVVGLKFLDAKYVAPYGTPVGQIALAVIFAVFAAGFLWMRRLARFDVPERFLTSKSAFTSVVRGEATAS